MAIFQTITYIACFVGIAVAVMESLYPSEKFQKQIKMLFSLVFILSVSAPMVKGDVSLSNTQYAVSASADTYNKVTDNSYNLLVTSIENNISTRISTELKQNKINCKNIETSINISDKNSISINEISLSLENNNQFDEAVCILKAEFDDDIKINLEE